MHIPEEEILSSWKSIRSVLKPNGRVLISIPYMRPELLENDRDRDGRYFKNYSPEFMIHLLKSLGFSQVDRRDNHESWELTGTIWFMLLFELSE